MVNKGGMSKMELTTLLEMAKDCNAKTLHKQ